MILTSENYHSPEANQAFFGNSQYKDFCGTKGMRGCESMALAKIRGQWKQEETNALLIGSFVDAHFEGTLDVFKAQHPDIFTKAGALMAAFKRAEEVITRIERDEYFMKYLSGAKQQIFTGELFGVQWKVKIDSLIRSLCLVDLKVMAAIRDSFWIKDLGHVTFVEFWGYDIQAAIYQKIVEINTGEKLPFFIAAASKEAQPDIEIIFLSQYDLDNALSMIEGNVKRIKDLKEGKADPDRCEVCDYCRATKILTKPIHFSELLLRI